MKLLLLFLLSSAGFTFTKWQTDFEKAKQTAKDENKLILLNFSGSDWCGPCIRLRKELFEGESFQQLANRSLILVNADFPRNKKNQLPAALQRQNESLADRYNPQGKFPLTLVLSADGKVIQSWEGFPHNNSAEFIEQIKSICDAGHR